MGKARDPLETDVCANCGQHTLSEHLVTRSFGKGNDLLLVENIPLLICGNCGESYFTAETMHEIERVKTHRRALATSRKVPVVTFA